MDRYEFNIKIEQMKKLMKKRDFATAVKIADMIDWRRVRENQLLIMAADAYEITGKYDKARENLLYAYERAGLGRQIAYRLCRLAVKRGDIAEAEDFYEEFTETSPKDAGKYILQYEIAKGKGEPLTNQIEILETFIEEDMDDRWAYELAKLYHKAQMNDKCVETCDTIILWFSDGKYVQKALELKQIHQPLSENQRIKYEAQKSKKKVAVASLLNESDDLKEDIKEDSKENSEEGLREEPEKNLKGSSKERQESDGALKEVHEADIDVNSIHVKDFSDNNKYDTINLQKELAKNVQSMFGDTIEIFKPARPVPVMEEEKPEDDQIEGQMNLEEVLAMFESGEIPTKTESEDNKDSAEEKLEEVVEETGSSLSVEEQNSSQSIEDLFENPITGKLPEEDEEDEEIVEEVSMPSSVEDLFENPIRAQVSEDEEEKFEEEKSEEEESDKEEFDEMEELASMISKDIEAEIQEEIEEEIKDRDKYSKEAESENAESRPIMFDIKSEIQGEIITAEDVKTEDAKSENVQTEDAKTEDIKTDEEHIAALMDEDNTAEELGYADEVEDVESVDEELRKLDNALKEYLEDDDDEEEDLEEEALEEIAEEDSEELEEELEESLEENSDENSEDDSEEGLEEEAVEEKALEEIVEYESEPEQEEVVEVSAAEADIMKEMTEEEEGYAKGALEEDDMEENSEAGLMEEVPEEASEESEETEADTVEMAEKETKKQSDIAKTELKKFIAKFSGVQGLDKQILKVMQSVLKTETEPVRFIFIKGEVKSGKTTLAIDAIKLANKIMQRRDQRIAKIKGASLNNKSMDGLLEVLDGSDVLIERVSDVEADVFCEFIDKLKEEGRSRIIAFEDEKALADAFLEKVPEEYRSYPNTIDIRLNKIRDWTLLAAHYAREKGYVIDEMGTLALSAKIDQLRAITLVVHKNHVEQLIDGAIADANKKTLSKLVGRFKNRTEDGYRILTEKNFVD